MSTFKTEADEPRERYCPDVIVAENAHRQIRIHQFVGQGIEVRTWRRHYEHGWVFYRESLKLKRHESIALIRAMVEVMKAREGRRLVRENESDVA